jgi:predicted RNase H-like HicB family nuclease
MREVRQGNTGGHSMVSTYTAKYTRISSGYMGQLVEWPEVITEGRTLEECRDMLQDSLREMIMAYQQQDKEIPVGGGLRKDSANQKAAKD